MGNDGVEDQIRHTAATLAKWMGRNMEGKSCIRDGTEKEEEQSRHC